MKKKILSFVLALILIVPLALGLTACGHTHSYNNIGLCESDGEYAGTTLTLDIAQTDISANVGDVKYFRFAVEKDNAYYITKTNISSSELKYYKENGAEISTMAYNSVSAYIAENSGYVYIVFEASAQISNAKITANHYVNEIGLSGAGYVGTTIQLDQTITVSLNKGEKAFYRFADPGDKLIKRTFTSPLQSGDFQFYTTTNSSPFYETISVTATPADFVTPFDGYLYIVITAGATFENGTFTVSAVV